MMFLLFMNVPVEETVELVKNKATPCIDIDIFKTDWYHNVFSVQLKIRHPQTKVYLGIEICNCAVLYK